MSTSRKVFAAAGLVIFGAAMALGVILLRQQGLDKASQWVTVMGFFVSTMIAGAGLLLGWRTWKQTARPVPEDANRRQRVHDVTVGGSLHQIRDVTGSVTIGSAASASSTGPAKAPASAVRTPASSGGQSVENTDVNQSINQVWGVGGDVEIDG